MSSDRPNILFIMTDQQSASALSCAGSTWIDTPNLDRLAARGVRFDAAYVAYPVCTPSRASIFSGRLPHETEAIQVRPPRDKIRADIRPDMLGHRLAAAGYRCGYGGKWHLNGTIDIPGDGSEGFEAFCGFDDFKLTEATLAWIDGAVQGDRPWFAVASYDDPHNICEWAHGQPQIWGTLPDPPPEDACPPLPANHAATPYEPAAVTDCRRWLDTLGYPIFSWGPREWRAFRWAYQQFVERVDRRIGELMDGLEARGLLEKTLIVMTSDHGDLQGEHQFHQKCVVYEACLRVPLIAAGPGIPAGRVIPATEPVSVGIDLFPTFCDYAEADLPDGLEGRSLRPLCEGNAESLDRSSIFGMGEPNKNGNLAGGCRYVRTARHKYVAYVDGFPNEELFDLENDPGEMINLARSEAHRSILLEHRQELQAWLDRTGDRFRGGHYGFPEGYEARGVAPGSGFPAW
ncbi:MAG: sulfatase family protein [Opitutales bacterium]